MYSELPPNLDDTVRHTDLPVKITTRPVEPTDVNFVLSSWMRSFRDAARSVSNTDFYAGQQKLIGALADDSNLVVACDEETPSFILGWACGKHLGPSAGLLLHYIYVKQGYRCLHLGSDLLRALGWRPGEVITATHWNRTATGLATKFKARHNPYLIMLGSK